MTCHARYRHRQTGPSVQRSLCAPRQGSACRRSARFVRDGTGKGRVFEKGSRAYLFRSSAPPTRPTRKSARLLDRQLSSDGNCRTGHRCGDKRSGVGIRGCGGQSSGTGAEGERASLTGHAMCLAEGGAPPSPHGIGSLEQDASTLEEAKNFWGARSASRQIVCFVVYVWRKNYETEAG